MTARKAKRRAPHKKDLRNDILAAAARLFVAKGYGATTIQDIVKAARTSIGNVYFYFENKEALAWVLLEEAATAAWAWTDEVLTGVPKGPARLAVIVMANAVNLLSTNAGLTRILLLGEMTQTLRERVAERFASRIRTYILDNVPSFPHERIDVAVAAWIGAGRNCIEQRLVGTLEGEPRDIAAFVVRWNLRGLGVPDSEIEEAIALASRVVAEQDGRPARISRQSATSRF